MDPPVVFLVSGGLSEGTRPFPLKIFNTKISVHSTSGECIKFKRLRKYKSDFFSPSPPQNVENLLMHSPEVELNEIFVSNIFNGNGLVPSDMPPNTKNTTKGSIILFCGPASLFICASSGNNYLHEYRYI